MSEKKANIAWMVMSIVGFVVMAISFLIMPINVTVEKSGIFEYVPGFMFWIGLLLGAVGQIVLAVRCRKWVVRRKRGHKKRIGLISFFKNIPAIIVDVSFVISLVGVIISTKITQGMGYICYVFLSICTLTFCLHCVFNGNIYKHLIGLVKTKEEEA